MYDKDGSSLSVWNAYRGDGWVKKGQNLAYVLCTQPLNKIYQPVELSNVVMKYSRAFKIVEVSTMIGIT